MLYSHWILIRGLDAVQEFNADKPFYIFRENEFQYTLKEKISKILREIRLQLRVQKNGKVFSTLGSVSGIE